jgi:hypothetical protein
VEARLGSRGQPPWPATWARRRHGRARGNEQPPLLPPPLPCTLREPVATIHAGSYGFCRFSLLQRQEATAGGGVLGEPGHDGPGPRPPGQSQEAQRREQNESEQRGQQQGRQEADRQQQQQQQQQQQGERDERRQPERRDAAQPPPCAPPLVAMPCEDASAIGLWALNVPAAGPRQAGPEPFGGARPAVRLEQARPKGTPQHGMAMAVQALPAGAGVSGVRPIPRRRRRRAGRALGGD